MKNIVSLITITCIAFSSCEKEESVPAISASELEAHIQKLASDEFQGRRPFTKGEKKTIAYIASGFMANGIEPGNKDSYLQEVPMVEITAIADPQMALKGKKRLTLIGREDYVVWTENPVEKIEWKDEKLVFAGFGVVAPEYNWNDYDGLDVKGKIVLVLVNDPGFGGEDSTFFKGNTMTYYGRWTYKFEEAARQGAKGCMVIHNTVPAGYAWNVPQNNWNSPHLFLDERGNSEVHCETVGWISMPATERLFEAAGLKFSDQQSQARKPGFKGTPLALLASTSLVVQTKYDKSYNVIGKITGTSKPGEFVLYTAHWDHLGIGRKDEKGDSIYNGAADNASGTAGLLELAKSFRALSKKPERTILFLAVTAEEQGLKGSAYYATNSIYPIDQTVANINLDGLNSYGKMKDIVVIGMGQSELEDYLREEAVKVGRYVAPDPHPVNGYYFRSDHFNFAKVGIPALFTGAGIDHAEKGKAYGQQLQDEFLVKYYHQPSDEFDTTRWNSVGAVDDLNLLFQIGKRLAYGSEWPQWKEGSEFRALRGNR